MSRCSGDASTNSTYVQAWDSASWPPKSLQAWRSVPSDSGHVLGHARSLWDPLESFFIEKGYRLFVRDSDEYDAPANRTEIRTPDAYHTFVGNPEPSRFWSPSNKLCAATKVADGTHVVLQLLAIGEDGRQEVKIQERLHRCPISTSFPNRAVSLLDMLYYEPECMAFGVFPLLCPGNRVPAHVSGLAALKACQQWMKAIAYLHSNLVAHLDIGPDEWLLNTGMPLNSAALEKIRANDEPFHELFDCQWSITDFETSVMFDPDSDPETWKVVGLCGGAVDVPVSEYSKMLGPEVWRPDHRNSPYCPFKHDVYQLGKTIQALFPTLVNDISAFASILKSMVAEDPHERPDMLSVLSHMALFLNTLTEEEKQQMSSYFAGFPRWSPDHQVAEGMVWSDEGGPSGVGLTAVPGRQSHEDAPCRSEPLDDSRMSTIAIRHSGRQEPIVTGPSSVKRLITADEASQWPPSTLQAWRTTPSDICYVLGHARSLWDPLESFFEEQGYRLFKLDSEEFDVPKDPTEVRAPDPYHVFIGDRVPSRFWCTSNKLCAATNLSDGTHVVLQLLAIGDDGQMEVQIQKRLHETPICTTYRNRAAPLLRLITYEKEHMVFGVFPLLCPGFKLPQHYEAIEGLTMCRQWFEALAYLHTNLVTHLDIALLEFLVNYGGPLDGELVTTALDKNLDFYTHFDYQWYITDFEFSLIFDQNSDPEERKVVGLGAGRIRSTVASYQKMLGPEVWRPENEEVPYCPFKHDIYQLGKSMQVYFRAVAAHYAGINNIFEQMTAADPSDRPTMTQVMSSMDSFLSSLSESDLNPLEYTALRFAGWLPEHRSYFAKLEQAKKYALATSK